jgi:hypothetical protein
VTNAAAEAMPPAKRPVIWPAVCLLIFGAIGSDPNMHIYLVLALIAAVVLFTRVKFNMQMWPDLYANWDQTYLCERCGAMMIPAP